MKKNLLFSKYLDLYDKVYYDTFEDYRVETDRIVKFLKPKTNDILDIGSGTGKHAVELLKKNFHVHCIDISNEAIKKTSENIQPYKNGSAEKADITTYHTRKKFDAALALFIVLSYVEREKLSDALRNVYALLKPQGVFIFDVVNGMQLDARFYKKITVKGNGIVIEWNRIKESKKKLLEASATIYAGNKIFKDHQTFHYYYPKEIRNLLCEIGFKNIAVYSDYLENINYTKSKTKLCIICKK